MILFPNAKINLGLDILRKRPDGYHDIETIMVPVPWHDILEIVPAKGTETTLTTSGREVNCPPEKNLVMKAFRALDSKTPLPAVDIYLHKIIPDGAGLGGGSADAAFTLKGLNELFKLGYNNDELADIAAELGADCPFFIYNRPMFCTGTGTDMSPIEIDLSGLTIAIIKPDVSVPTSKAYSQTHPSIPPVSLSEIIKLPVSDWPGKLTNDFESSVFPEYPTIASVKKFLQESGAIYTAISGSGSAVFGLYDSAILADNLSSCFKDCQIFVARL